MRNLVLFFMLMISAKMNAQQSYISLVADKDSGGGVAGYCLSGHSLQNFQTKFVDPVAGCVNGYTYAYYYIASRDRIEPNQGNNINKYGFKMTGGLGLNNFIFMLNAWGFNARDVKITFGESSLGNDAQNADWFIRSNSLESRIYHPAPNNQRVEIWLGNHLLIYCNLPEMLINIDYQDRANCSDDLVSGRTNFARAYNAVFNGVDNRPAAVQAVADALLQDIGNKGIGLQFESLTSSIINGFVVPNNIQCPNNQAINPSIGNFFVGNAKIVFGTAPIDSNTTNPIPSPNACTTLQYAAYSTANGEWLHINDNGNPVLSIFDNLHMGNIDVVYNTTNNIRSNNGIEYMGRDIIINSTDEPAEYAKVRLYFTAQEWASFMAANDGDMNDVNDLLDITKIAITRTCDLDCQAGLNPNGFGEFIAPTEIGIFNNGFYVDFYTSRFGHFYIHGAGGLATLLPYPPSPQGVNGNCIINGTTNLTAPIQNIPNGMSIVWVSNDENIARVATGAQQTTGVVTAVANGNTWVSYYVLAAPNCKQISPGTQYSVNPVIVWPITGANSVCIGSTEQLSTNSHNGVWSSVAGRATVNNAGVITGQSAGVATIRYTVRRADGCTGFASKNVNVFALPSIPSIKYAPGTINPQAAGTGYNICLNRNFDVIGSPVGGVFSSSDPAILSVTRNFGFNVHTYNVRTLSLGKANVTYVYTDNHGCSNSRTINTKVINCPSPKGVATNEFNSKHNYTLYPNPATFEIKINIDYLEGNGHIVITDLLGKTVKQQNLSLGINTIDISNLSKGMYITNIVTQQGKQTEKLIIQ